MIVQRPFVNVEIHSEFVMRFSGGLDQVGVARSGCEVTHLIGDRQKNR